MSTWICDGTMDGQTYLEGGGRHEPWENTGDHCEFCGLHRPDHSSSYGGEKSDLPSDVSSTEITIDDPFPKSYRPLILGGLGLILLFLSLGFLGTQLLFPNSSVSPKEKDPEMIASPSSPLNFIPYENSQYGLKISYPDTWERQEQLMITTGELVTFFSPKNQSSVQFRERVILSVIDLSHHPHPLSLNEYSQIVLNKVASKSHLSLTPTTLSHRKAATITFLSQMEGKDVQIREVWTLYNNRAYVLTHITEQDPSKSFIVDAMIKSLNLTL